MTKLEESGDLVPLGILMVSTSYPESVADWKGTFIRNSLLALAQKPDLAVSVWQPPGPVPSSVRQIATETETAWFKKLMDEGGIAHLLRNRPVKGLFRAGQMVRNLRHMYRRSGSYDLRHVNWLQCAFGIPNDKTPLVASVLGTDLQLLRLPGMSYALRRAFSGRQVALCPNSLWAMEPLQRTFGDIAKVRYLPFGIDCRWFSVVRKVEGPPRWLCISRLTTAKIGPLFDWGDRVFGGTNAELVLIGPNQENLKIPPWVNYLGPLGPEQICEEWFPRATGILTLSNHSEGRPQVLLEAMAAGLPILASDHPAHQDLIDHGKTGWIIDSSESFDNGLSLLSEMKTNRAMSGAAKKKAQDEFGTWSTYARRLRLIYRELLDE